VTPAPPLGPPPPAFPDLGDRGGGTPPAPPPPAAGGHGRAKRVAVIAAIAVLTALVGFGIGRASSGDDGDVQQAAATSTTVKTTPASPGATSTTTKGGTTPTTGGATQPNTNAPALDQGLEPAAAVNKAVSPGVVQIETNAGLGSGFIYDKQGYILTAAHVVERDRSVTVRLANGTGVNGTVVGADDNNDVAVVKIDPQPGMAVVSLALDAPPVVGQTAIAIGSPFGLDQTVTQGIVSAVNRPVQTGNNYVGMIQTDAAINSGTSGGPLVDRSGKVIGINVQIRTDTGDNAGIGFAVPIDLAYDVAQQLIAGKPIELGYLGVSSTDDPGNGRTGALLTRVEAGSPAAQAGLQVGDLVTAVDGAPIKDFTALAAKIRATQPGKTITLSIERNGQRSDVTVTIGKAAR
jgi:S1-C subfamily serine protease